MYFNTINNQQSTLSNHECRICFEQDLPLIKPCNCEGTMSYIHPNCLTEWRISFLKEHFKRIIQEQEIPNDYDWKFPLFHKVNKNIIDFSELETSDCKAIAASMIPIYLRNRQEIENTANQIIQQFIDLERNDFLQCPTCKKNYIIYYQKPLEKYNIITNYFQDNCDYNLNSILFTICITFMNLFITWWASLIFYNTKYSFEPFTFINSNFESDTCSTRFNFQFFYFLNILYKVSLFIRYYSKVKNNIHSTKKYYSRMLIYIIMYLWCTFFYIIMYSLNNCEDIHSAIWLQYPFYTIYIFQFLKIHERTIISINETHKFCYIEK